MLNKLKRFIGSDEPVQQKSEEIEQQQYIQYAQELEQSLSRLEAGVHESDDPSWIKQSDMKTALDFYKGDWIGFLEVDLELGLWTPTHWYNPYPNDKTLDLLQEFESAEFLHRWVAAMHDNSAIVVPDMEEVRDQFPGEYAVYQRLMAKSVLAVPVKPRPMGFLVIRNPQRYLTRSSMLQLLAFVVLACVNEQKLMQSMKMSFSPENIENDADIIINLFGDLEIYTSSGVLREGDLKSPKCCRLLAYMLLNKKVTIPAMEIAEAIWPEEAAESDNPGKNLRALVFRLRQAFALVSPHQLIETTTNGYRFNPDLHIMTDLQLFDKYWNMAQQTGSTSARVEILKQAVELYKGKVLASAESEHWIMLTASHYDLRYTGVVNELLKTLEDAKDYQNLHKYAAQSLAVAPGNVKAHYWLIVAMFNLGADEMADTQLEAAKRALTDEEYYELVEALKKAKITEPSNLFRNEKLSI